MSPERVTKEIVNTRLADRGIVMPGEYVAYHTKTLFQCCKGHTWKATPANVIYGTGCPHCSGNVPLTKEIVNTRLADRGIVMLDEYVSQKTKARFQCSKGHAWESAPGNVLYGKDCPECGRITAGNKRRLTSDTIRDRLKGRGITMRGKYVTANTKTLFQCTEGHSWEATPGSVMGGNGCPHCAGRVPLTKEIVNIRLADRRITLLGEYTGTNTKTLFQCGAGHTWEGRPGGIMQGGGCPHCAGQAPLSKEIVNARIAGRGIVMLGEYRNVDTKMLFQCSEGHTWKTTPYHVSKKGTGCPYCSRQAPLTTEIVNARIADRGIFMLDEFITNSVKVRFQCSEGHIWAVKPNNVLNGRGCPDCAEPGFNPSEPGLLYYIAVTTDDGDPLYKIGITNLSVERRFPSADRARIRIVKTWRFAVGRVAALREAEILSQFARHRYYGPDILEGHGNTELFTHDVLGLDRQDHEHGQSVVDADANFIGRPFQLEFDFRQT
jgi:hypothetical protein